ncbi:pyrimidine pathway regulatory protein 1 [Rhypophila decipiens]|uniref:Pyrimidine pathway regulatory protein 1 n=1 Tax=Rhypophila decipiens TaxID=261697 RepID=A0AAN6YFN9_9PEZI|nr:pyrimidine pathway regulatory protein 1 [Rhypophila decipiens]
MVGTSMSPQSRQQPGCACEQCRKRKLRCDRQRPQCGTCAEAGIACEVNTNRQARGPKKGDLKALRSRIVALERRLSVDFGENLMINGGLDASNPDSCHLGIDSALEQNVAQVPSLYDAAPGAWENRTHVQLPITPPQPAETLPFFRFPPSPPSSSNRVLIDDLMRTDLDMLYFDRVHPNIPIFNQSRYFAHSRLIVETGHPNHQVCLQYAMWTLAMALSSQFDNYRDLLYRETKQMLEALEAGEEEDMGMVPIEHVQSWLLVTFYEFTRANFRRGWTSAGRAFRLVQLANLHVVDSPDSMSQGDDLVLLEERRRTFWVAYCLDRFINIRRDNLPLTLTEEAICTRLPSPDMAFQSGHPIPGCFLSEVIGSTDHSFLSTLAESVVITTLCSRANSHCHASRAERRYGCPPADFWLRHEWLDGMLARRLGFMMADYSVASPPLTSDPMLLFTFMMAEATLINLSNVAAETSLDGALHGQIEPGNAVGETRRRTLDAAVEITRLVRAHEQIGYFKAHIFLPSALLLGVSCLGIAQHHNLKTTSEVRPVFPVTGAGARSGVDAGRETEMVTGLEGGIGHGRGEDRVAAGEAAAAREHQDQYEPALRSCLNTLRKMQSFNNLARSHLSLLE